MQNTTHTARETELSARYVAIQDELAKAPSWKMDSLWWTDRIAELQLINRTLGR